MENKVVMYDIDSHIAEVYDQVITHNDDVALIRTLSATRDRLRILEPFCGTGRILITLALDGHDVTGMDLAKGMLARAQTRVALLPLDVQRRITLVECDVTSTNWPQGFDMVVLGGNCFYELATPKEQEWCVASAAASLKPGGHVYIDNNHMEGQLDASWQTPEIRQGFPTGVCGDGTSVESTIQTIWFDVPHRLARFRRCTKVVSSDGHSFQQEYEQQKHPVSMPEVQNWLHAHGFTIEQILGDRRGNPYEERSDRAIFWARKT